VTTINYKGRLGWVGMVLVHPEKRRRGIGTALLRKAIDYLKGIGVETIKLDATPEGKNVYAPLGFMDEYDLERRQGIGVITDCEEFQPILMCNLQDVVSFDANAFGAERGKVIESLLRENPDKSFTAKNQKGQIEGYIMARNGSNAHHIGPWVSNSASVAEGLFALVLRKLAGEKIFLDIPCVNKNGIKIAERYNFTVQRSFTRMFLGNNTYPGKPLYVYSTSGAEKG